MTIAQNGTWACSRPASGMKVSPIAKASPISTPTAPPTRQRTTASRRNWSSTAAGITAIAGGIVGISLLVGGIGIMNIMLVSVSERTREIGLRKAVGATPSAVLLQFLLEAVVLCLVGGAVGVLIGQAFAIGLTFIPDAGLEQAHVPFWAIVMSFSFSAAVGVVFGMFPAIKASRLDPIEALRHE